MSAVTTRSIEWVREV